MSDDFEPSLGDHLRHRASRVHATPDLDDVHHRIDQRQQRRTRALGAALAVALVAGPVLGWTLARASEPDRDNVTAAGGGDDASQASGAPTSEGGGVDAQSLAMALVSDRTTTEGIRLVVHATELGDPDGPCVRDGLVRVAVVDGNLVDVVYISTAPGGSTFQVAGMSVERPVWVVVARGHEHVSAAFPNGTRDVADAAQGVAVLAGHADPADGYEVLSRDVIDINGESAALGVVNQKVALDDGSGGCPGGAPLGGPPVTMPEPGEPPADEAAARADIEALFSGFGGRDPEIEMDEHERPNVWRDADRRFREEHPEYLEWAKETESVPLEIVFTAPDRATVRYELISDNPEIPVPGERVGDAVLINGTWKVSIETSCGNLRLAGIECDLSILG